MFGIGPQELIIIGIIFLIIFGPGKLPEIARDLGHFVNEARRSVEEVKSEFSPEEAHPDEDKHKPEHPEK